MMKQENGRLYIAALIGINFLWTGAAYIAQAYRLLAFLDGGQVNLITCGAYYVCQAAGMGLASLLCTKNSRILLVLATLAALICTASSLFSASLSLIVVSGATLNIAIGVLSGATITRLATDVPQQRRGLVFGCAYAFGSVGTWLLSLPMRGRFLWHDSCFIAITVLALASLLLLRGQKPLAKVDNRGNFRMNIKLVWLASAVLIALCAVNTLGFSFPLKAAAGCVSIEFTRAFYGVGLIVAGIISDKNRRWGAICCLASLAFPFAALALGSSVTGETIMWMLAYLFLGFLSVYRILVFSDISGKLNLPAMGAFGLIAGRLGEAIGTLVAETTEGTLLIILAGIAFAMVIALFMALYQKLYASVMSPEEKLTAYAHRFNLTAREREILTLIVQGMSNAEIAGTLYITESTVKFHAGNIFKKTSFVNRSQLIADYKLGGH